ncbi:GlcG/HbpS family heme-binding protein [Acidimangrovimonas sediminis]|uniref:GlcG/HbpS family heme-binding protein n=1 Tax=Acidimangrovimonas sediminis TaxID=2056283 RepID=UPI000C800040|nr:heme-binding protein [Acidimangrovimonas sediminis]
MTGISLQTAQAIIAGAFAQARADGLRPMALMVVDPGGHPIAFAREDGAAPGRFGLAQGKAHGSAMLQIPGSTQMALSDRFPVLMGAANGVFDGKFVPVPGGVLVRNAEGRLLGAVGVSGGMPEEDAAVACAGIRAAGLTPEA